MEHETFETELNQEVAAEKTGLAVEDLLPAEEIPAKKNAEFFRVVKFVLFSISAGLIEIGSFAILNETLHWLSYMIALVLSVLWNFTLNRKFTFKSAANVPIAMLKVAAYYAVFTPLTSWLEHVYTMRWGWNEYIATGVNMILNLVTEFLYQRFFVFGNSLDTKE